MKINKFIEEGQVFIGKKKNRFLLLAKDDIACYILCSNNNVREILIDTLIKEYELDTSFNFNGNLMDCIDAFTQQNSVEKLIYNKS